MFNVTVVNIRSIIKYLIIIILASVLIFFGFRFFSNVSKSTSTEAVNTQSNTQTNLRF